MEIDLFAGMEVKPEDIKPLFTPETYEAFRERWHETIIPQLEALPRHVRFWPPGF